MSTCPNCGHENNEGDRFCASCGTRLTPVAPPKTEQQRADSYTATAPTESTPDNPESAPESTPSSIPPPATPSFAQQNPWDRPEQGSVDDDWKMSDLGPPPKRKRPIWMWILLTISILILLCCVGGYLFYAFTDTGQEIWDDAMATAESIATEQADGN